MSRRRSYEDPLAPHNEPTWLVVQTMAREFLKVTELPPRTDLRATLNEARAARIAAGWVVENEIERFCSSFFCNRDGFASWLK